MAGGTRGVDAGEEQQFDHDEPLPLAAGATPFGDIEGEPPGVVAALTGFGCRREQGADVVEKPGVGGQVGARCAADRLLVDLDQSPDPFQPADDPTLGRDSGRVLESGFVIRIIPGRGRGAKRAGNQLDQRLAH